MHHGIEGAAPFINATQDGSGDLAEIGQVDAHARADRLGQGLLVDVEDLIAMLDQVAQNRPPQLSTPTRHQNLGHSNLLYFHANLSRIACAANRRGGFSRVNK